MAYDWVDMEYFNFMVHEATEDSIQGNERFQRNHDLSNQPTAECLSYVDLIETDDRSIKCETFVQNIFSFANRDHNRILQMVLKALDNPTAPAKGTTAIRSLALTMAQQHPADFFRYHQGDGKYWDIKGDEPKLRTDLPVAKMWLLVSFLLGDPWTFNYDTVSQGSEESSDEDMDVALFQNAEIEGPAEACDHSMISELSRLSVTQPRQPKPPIEEESPPDTYLTKAMSPPIPRKNPTIADKLSRLRQANIEGLPGNCFVLDATFSLTWSGCKGDNTIAKAWVRKIVDTFADIFKHTDEDFHILPMQDTEYKDVAKWIKHEVQLRHRITNLRELKKYIDPDYGNSPYALTSNKAGEKRLNTRIRVAVNVQTELNHIQAQLDETFKLMGPRAECKRSPLQVGSITRVGFLCFYP